MNTATTMYISMFSNPAPMPLKATLSIINAIGTIPASGLRLSCIALTEPFEVGRGEGRPGGRGHRAEADLLPLQVRPDRATGKPAVAAAGLDLREWIATTQPTTSNVSITPIDHQRVPAIPQHDPGHHDRTPMGSSTIEANREQVASRGWGSRKDGPSSARRTRRHWSRACLIATNAATGPRAKWSGTRAWSRRRRRWRRRRGPD